MNCKRYTIWPFSVSCFILYLVKSTFINDYYLKSYCCRLSWCGIIDDELTFTMLALVVDNTELAVWPWFRLCVCPRFRLSACVCAPICWAWRPWLSRVIISGCLWWEDALIWSRCLCREASVGIWSWVLGRAAVGICSWRLKCNLRWVRCEARYGQWGQAYGFSPVWVRTCWTRTSERTKDLPQ